MAEGAGALRALQAAASKNALPKVLTALANVDVSSAEVAAILRQAVARGHAAVAAALLAAGARPAAGEGVPLLIAALRADAPSLVGPLLAALPPGTDVDQTAAPDGWTALFWAAKCGDAPAVGALLAAGAAVNATERMGGTPLMVAVQHSRLAAAEALLSAGANVEAADGAGWSAMLWAAQARPHAKSVSMLRPSPAAYPAVLQACAFLPPGPCSPPCSPPQSTVSPQLAASPRFTSVLK
jgi:ankyrin repeat protein